MEYFGKGLARLTALCSPANLALAKKHRFLAIAEKRWNRHWQKNGRQKNGVVGNRRGPSGALAEATVA
jgi:hypothetical protein